MPRKHLIHWGGKTNSEHNTQREKQKDSKRVRVMCVWGSLLRDWLQEGYSTKRDSTFQGVAPRHDRPSRPTEHQVFPSTEKTAQNHSQELWVLIGLLIFYILLVTMNPE
jgi:hypothetical protein